MVPVTTVPKPRSVNTRSIGTRKRPVPGRGAARPAARSPRSRRQPRRSGPDRQPRRVGQEGPGERGGQLVVEHRQPVVVDQVALGDDHQAAAHAEQLAHVEVLAGLGHDALVGRHHQQHQIEAGRAGHHRADESLVAGHVDHRDPRAAGQIEVREAQLGGDAARLLDRQPIGVDAGQRVDQRGLAVVDVAGGADDEGPGRGHSGRSRSSRLRILPVGLRGSSSRNTTWRGRL
jgi:hypothetical protein